MVFTVLKSIVQNWLPTSFEHKPDLSMIFDWILLSPFLECQAADAQVALQLQIPALSVPCLQERLQHLFSFFRTFSFVNRFSARPWLREDQRSALVAKAGVHMRTTAAAHHSLRVGSAAWLRQVTRAIVQAGRDSLLGLATDWKDALGGCAIITDKCKSLAE